MRTSTTLLLAFLALISYGQTAQDFEGTWELHSFIDHVRGGTEWEEYERRVVFQKHIAGGHFTWVRYDSETSELLGMGGGTYTVDDGMYIENLDFFYPPGSNELGQTIPFRAEFDREKWYHTGQVQVYDIGLEGESVVVDSIKIEEIWKPISRSRNDADLIGAWELTQYKDSPESEYMVYPEFIGYMKIITPSHFVWIKWDREGDQIFAAGSGPYRFKTGEEYVEELDFHFPASYSIGQRIVFDCALNGNQWKHFGVVDNEDGSVDQVDEYWSPKIVVRDFNDLDLD